MNIVIRKRELEFKKSYGINAYSDKGSLSFNTLNKM